MKTVKQLILIVNLACCFCNAQENKRFTLFPSVYLGANYVLTQDNNSYSGIIGGLQAIVKEKNYFAIEYNFMANNKADKVFMSDDPVMENIIITENNAEIDYGRIIFASKSNKYNGSFSLLWQTGLRMQYIFYQGKYLYTPHSANWFSLDFPVYEWKEYWQPAFPLKIKAMINSRWIGCSVDLYANISKNTDYGLRGILYLGLLKKRKE